MIGKNGISTNAYKPHETLIRHLQKRLENEEMYRRIKDAGGELSPEETKSRDYLIQEKVRILNKYVFESMANVTTFLEYCMGPILGEIFEDDIEELLLGANHDKELGKAKTEPWLMTEYWDQPILTRFLNASLTWHYRDDPDNFRIKIFSIMQRLIGRYLMAVTQTILGLENPSIRESSQGLLANEKFHDIVNNELARLVSFTDILTKNVKIKNSKPSRPVLF